MKILSLKLSEDLDTEVALLARERGVSKSTVVREAIEALVARRRRASPRSFAALAADYIGRLEGPGTLSSDSKRMEGFGQ